MHVHTSWEYYDNGKKCIEGEEVDRIIEEIIAIMRRKKITVETAAQILDDTKEVIKRETVIT